MTFLETEATVSLRVPKQKMQKSQEKTDEELEMLCQYYKYSYEMGQGNSLSSVAVDIDEIIYVNVTTC